MNHHKFLLSAPYDDVDVETEGPTFAIAIGQALPNLSRCLGNSRTILGARPFQDGCKDFYGFELDVDPDEVTPDLLTNRYGARQPVPAPSDLDHLEIEAYDVYETMDSIEGLLRYAAQDLIDDESRHGLIRARALEYRQAVSDVLVYDPKAKIDIVESLAEIFDGRDWGPFFPPERIIHPVVQIAKVAIVEKSEDVLLLRFDYQNGDEYGRELEFVDIKKGRYCIRRSRYSALRSFDPAFNGWQLPAVYNALQEALDTECYTNLSDTNWSACLPAHET